MVCLFPEGHHSGARQRGGVGEDDPPSEGPDSDHGRGDTCGQTCPVYAPDQHDARHPGNARRQSDGGVAGGVPLPVSCCKSNRILVQVLTPSSLQEMQENVKKCKNFLATLIKLASHNSPSPDTSKNVKALVQDLLVSRYTFLHRVPVIY